MRKIFITLAILCLGLSLFAEETAPREIKFGLLGSPVYKMDMRLSAELRRIYVTVDFDIDRASLPQADYHSFFLSKEARIEQIFINGKLSAPILTTNLVPEHFIPVLNMPALLDSSAIVTCYSFNLNSDSKDPAISFKLKYSLPMPEWTQSSEGINCAGYLTEQMWFPRNLTGASTVHTKMVSSISYKLELGDVCQFEDKNGIRTHTGTFEDAPGKAHNFRIIKG